MKIVFKNLASRVFTVLVLGCSLCSNAYATQEQGTYKVAKRYNMGGQLTGVISPDPDDNGPLPLPATRNTYNSSGWLTTTEIGYLSTWQDDTVPPANWVGFVVSREQQFTHDSIGRKLTELTIPRGANSRGENVLTQYTYNWRNLVECKAVRMNPAAFDELIRTAQFAGNACALGPEGDRGPDRITKYLYEKEYPLVAEEHRAVGTDLEQVYVKYAYSRFKEIISVTDANNNRSGAKLDGFGRIQYWYYPEKSKESANFRGTGNLSTTDYEKYSYDNNGNRMELRKRDGRIIKYQYDRLNRMIFKDIPGGSANDVYIGYDLRGLQTYARFASHSGRGITREYDGFKRLHSETDNTSGGAKRIEHGFDANGNRTKITHPDNQFFIYEYDGLSRLEKIKENGSTVLTDQGYDVYNRPDSLSRANAVQSTLDYDGISRVFSMSEMAGSRGDLNVTHSFTYNPASQVVDQTITDRNFHYQGAGGETGTYKVNGLNQYTSVDGTAISYDDNANLTSDGATTYEYDVENRLIKATGLNNATLAYDPLGRLHRITANGQSRRFLYDGAFIIAQYNDSDTLTHRYIHGLGREAPLVEYVGTDVGSSNRRFLHTNHLGSVIAGTDVSGNTDFINTYNQYGVPNGANTGLFAYTGQIYLPELQLYHYKARIYSPYIGRFFQTDPVGFKDDVNLYSYVGNDPMNSNDPTGKFLNFVAKFAVDVSLTVAIQVATGEPVDLGAALVDAAVGSLNPAKTIQKVAKLGKALSKAKGKAKTTNTSKSPKSGSCCFVAGTQVLTEQGNKNIEDVQLGEKLWAKDIDTGEQAWKPVTRIFVEPDRGIYEIKLLGEDGFEQTIKATDDHPFYVVAQGWKTTIELTHGDQIETDGSGPMKVVSVIDENREELTYNFTVADFHTYYVTERRVLVHNCDKKGIKSVKTKTWRGADGRKQVDKKYTSKTQAKKAAKKAGFFQKKGAEQRKPEQHKKGGPHFHDKNHNNKKKPNVHYSY